MKTVLLILFLLGMAIWVNYLYTPMYDEFIGQLETDLRHHQGKAGFDIGNMHVTPSFEQGVFVFRVPRKPVTYAGASDDGERKTWER